ncbi:MAG: SMC-Scp complex subunit ScpB [Bacteriovoracaceae bacterium]|nr:SMC-Scp complex subunit ScpB [Bacteriovoracaceae bacterium]
MSEINYSWDLTAEAELESALSAAANLEVDEVQASVTEETFALELNHFDQTEQEDMMWQARTGLNADTLCGAVETLIFMSDRPISLQKIKAQIDEELPLRVLHESISKLQVGYEAKHHGIRLVEVADGYQFRTKATYAKHVQNLFKVQSLVLTPTALEVLAIIAYKQPVSKTEIEKIRGVDSSHIVRALMDKRLVKITGRSEELGRPSVFGTTEEFLEVFNLANIEQLPPEHELAELATRPEVAAIADIKSVVFGGDRKKFDFDELEELDKLSESIKDIASETDFTMLLKQEEKRRIDGNDEGVKKSAFDILEEFVLRDATIRQNREAMNSEPLMTALEPKTADVSFEGVLNAPEIDEEWEAQNRELVVDDEAQGDWIDLNLAEESEEEFTLEDEARELEEALNMAFANLTGEKLSDANIDTSAEEENLDEHLKTLDFTVDSAIKKGIELDMDLSFLNEALPEDDITDSIE